MSVRLKDLSAELGMSVSTISRILRDDPRASEFRACTRERVLCAARRLGYRRNLSAATIRNGYDSSTVGILLNEEEHAIYPVVLRMVKNLNQRGFGVHVYCDDDIEGIFQGIFSNQIRYLVNFRRKISDLDISVGYCRPKNLRMAIARNQLLYADFPSFGSNDKQIMYDMVAYLYNLGHRKIALHCGMHSLLFSANEVRHDGFLAALSAFNLEDCFEMTVCPENYTDELFLQLWQKHRPTAICCVDTAIALKIELLLRDIGVAVPDDVSLIAFGDMPHLLQYSRPQITSMQEIEQCDMLDEILRYFHSDSSGEKDGDEFSLFCDATLIERGSTAAPSSSSQPHLQLFPTTHDEKAAV